MEENLIWKKVSPERVSKYELAFNVALWNIEKDEEYFTLAIEDVKARYDLTEEDEETLKQAVCDEMFMIQNLSIESLFAIYDNCKSGSIYYNVKYNDHIVKVPATLVCSTIINEIKRRVK